MENAIDRLLKPDVLVRIPLLSDLRESELENLAQQMRVRRYGKGEMVIGKGSGGDALMFLLAGSLQVVDYTEDGKEIGLNLFSPGNFFGELALIDGQPRSASIVALETSAVAFLPRAPAQQLVYGNPPIAEKMLKHFANSIRNLTLFRSLLAIPSIHQRLYALLCHMKQPGSASEEVVSNLPTQQQIASMINTSRETVSRVMAELQQKGILQKNKRTLVIIRPQTLERLARSGEAEV